MRAILPLLFLSCFARAVDVQLWTSFEAGNSGNLVTNALLEASTVKVSGLGYWTNRGTEKFVVSTGNISIPGDVTVGTVPGADIGGRSVLYTADTYFRYPSFVFTPTTMSNVSAGCWINFNASSSFTYGAFDLFGFNGWAGEFVIAQLDDKPGGQYSVACHTHAGTSSKIAIATNGTYWVALKWASGASGLLSIYDTNLTLVGSTNLSQNAEAIRFINIGRMDNHAVSNDSRFYYDNLIVSTNGEWPLLPSTSHVATTYYVDQSAGGANTGLSWANAWTDITNAASYALPGDTVLVTNGTYQNIVSPLYDGRSDARIKWVAKGSSRAAVKTVGWQFTNDYHSLVGFDISHTNIAGTQNYSLVLLDFANGIEIIDNAIHDSESSANYGIAVSDSANVVLRGNDVWNMAYPYGPLYTSVGAACISLGTFNDPATNVISEYNWLSYASDYHVGMGTNLVMRNNVTGPIDDSTEAHVDGFQNNQTATGVLIENTTQYQSRDPGVEGVHYFLNSATCEETVIRGGIIVDSFGVFFFDNATTNFSLYNNTFVNAQYISGTQVYIYDNSRLEARNNIWHTSTTANGPVYSTSTGGTVSKDYEVVYPSSTGYSSTNSVESDPLLVSTNNASPDFRIGSSSPARNASGGITFTTASGSGSASLPVANIYRFFPGDWIYVGAAGPAKITTRTVTSGSAGTFTLNTNLTWSSGDAVRWSTPSGVRYSDIGAFPYSASVETRTASYTQNGSTITASPAFEARMAVLYDANGIPGDPIYAPSNFTWTASSGVSKVRIYPWFAPYNQSQRWVDATAGAITINATTANVGTIVIR